MRLRSGKVAEEQDTKEIGSYHQKWTSHMTEETTPTQSKFWKDRVNLTLANVHFNIFLYSTCFWIQQGVFPRFFKNGKVPLYLSAKLGSGSVVFGYLQTTFAAVQLCSGPFFGRLGDVYGGRAALTLAFLSSALSYFLLGIATNITMLFMSRLASVFMHCMQGGQMVVTDLASSDKRVATLGKLSISYGIGMVVGPFLGGQLAKYYGEQNAAFMAFAGSIFSAVLCYLQIPTHTKKFVKSSDVNDHGDSADEDNHSSWSVFDPRKYLSVIKHEKAFILLIVRFVTGIPIGIFQSMFPIVAKDTYGLNPEQNGYLMSYIGILSMLIQGLAMAPLKKKYSEMQLIKRSVVLLILTYLAMTFVTNIWQMVVVMAPLVLSLAVLTVVITAALTNSVEERDTGTILGINMAVNSLVRTMSPIIGGYILEWYGFPIFGYLGCVNSAMVAVFLLIKFRNE